MTIMSEKIPKAKYDGAINVGNSKIPCAVLEDGTRLLTQEGFLKAIGRSKSVKGGMGSSVDGTAAFLRATNLKPFISKELERSTTPIEFMTLKSRRALGFRAELLPEVCKVYLEAQDAGVLNYMQTHVASACNIIIRGLASVGIIALIDEATGYQEIRDKKALEKILEVYIVKELMKWQKRFPDEWYEHLFRLKNLEWKGRGFNPPQYIGRITNDIIYDRLPAGIKEELSKLNPPDEKGQRKHRHHQFLTNNIGHPKLQEIITGTLTLMRISPNWRVFYSHLQRAFPKFGDQSNIEN